MMNNDTYERALEQWEIEERKNKALELMEEWDGLDSTIGQHQRQIRTLKLRQSTVDSRIRLLRHEVRSGKTLVDRQAELPYADTLVERPRVPGTEDGYDDNELSPLLRRTEGIDASTSDPAPEIDPPARHGEGPLLDAIELRHLITCVRPREFWPSVKEVGSWHNDVAADVQRWCRIELARKMPIAGQPIPFNTDMPNVLKNIKHKPKRGARPLANPPAKKKRRSGSTQHSD